MLQMLTLVICGLYAGFDELHQHFADKRNARLTDMCIDEYGAVISIVLAWLFAKIKNIQMKFNSKKR